MDLIRGAVLNLDNGIGFLAWLLALALPLRHFKVRAQVLLDLFAIACVLVFSDVVSVPIGVLIDTLSERIEGWYAIVDVLPLWLLAPAYVVAADFGAYWAHRGLHSRWLWSTHAWHHSPKYLYWLSGQRASLIHVFVLLTPYFLAYMLFPVPETAIIGTAIVALDAANQHVIHSNIKLPYARRLELLFVTPRFHFVHHNARIAIANSNYGFIFSVWDRWFGTYTDPETVPLDDPLGLGYEISTWRLLLGVPKRRDR
jgi:sterol desaturase/sphingolipid hydroxylase (fatty acid hydroxylase superfamily)